jgi:hypothetical protein
MERREFLTLVGCSALTLTAAAVAGPEKSLLWAASEGALSESDQQALSAAVNRIIPHTDPALKKLAGQTAQTLATRMKSDPALRGTVQSVIAELNDQSRKTYDKPFAGLIPEQQNVIMEKVQASGSFQHLVNQVLADYYDKPQVWHALGYPGPVNDHEHMEGGYLAKGYDKLDW